VLQLQIAQTGFLSNLSADLIYSIQVIFRQLLVLLCRHWVFGLLALEKQNLRDVLDWRGFFVSTFKEGDVPAVCIEGWLLLSCGASMRLL
jgi:hypothetical protein